MTANVWGRFRRLGPARRKTVVLHAGAGKTGTSAIQTWLARNHERLDRFGVHYPKPPEGFGLAVEGKITSGNAGQLVKYVNHKRRANGFDETRFFAWLDEALRHPADTVLFSSEGLQSGDAAKLAALKRHLEERNCGVIVIYAVRNAADHLFSRWGQLVKRHGSFLSWDQFCRDGSVPFLTVLDRLSGVFGPEAVQVVNYERNKHDIVRQVMALVSPADFGDTQVGTVNRSLSEREMALMRVFNAALSKRVTSRAHRDRLSTALSDYLIYAGDLPPMRLSLTEEQFARLTASLGETVGDVNRRYLPNEPILVADPEVVRGKLPVVELTRSEVVFMRDLAARAASGALDLRTLRDGADPLRAMARSAPIPETI